jgi:tetratricopeptide (TPR) repeat protein
LPQRSNALLSSVSEASDGHDTAERLFQNGLQLQQQGHFKQAADVYRRCIDLDERYLGAHLNLGGALNELGMPLEALAAYRRALALRPLCAEAHNNIGVILRGLAQIAPAIAALRRAIELKSDYVEAHNNLGLALSDAGDLPAAERCFRRALQLRPDYAHALSHLSATQKERGDLTGAVQSSCRAIQLRPDYAGAYNNLGSALKELGRSAEALACYERAASLRLPGFDTPWVNKALMLLELGRRQEALQASDEALAVNARSGAAWHARSEMKRFTADDPDLARMQALLQSAQRHGMRIEHRAALQFALGKAWLDAGDGQRAFEQLHEANRLRRSSLAYDSRAHSQWTRRIAQIISPAWLQQHAQAGCPSELPIFVVGMPRSGTTLIEQILASHPDVHGAGELPLIWQLTEALSVGDRACNAYPEVLRDLPDGDLTRLGERYVSQLRSRSRGQARVVDKLPMNFLFAGLIHRLLPNARIIHCRRDPMDVGLSCYTKNFRTGLAFSFDLREIGLFYRDYDCLMHHWRETLPAERFLEVSYEDVVEDIETQARRLVQFCGLAWDPACLQFHNTQRPVTTFSAEQVRRPLYRDSIGRWRLYAQHLQPLRDALGVGSP